jgi:hypothetical protein
MRIGSDFDGKPYVARDRPFIRVRSTGSLRPALGPEPDDNNNRPRATDAIAIRQLFLYGYTIESLVRLTRRSEDEIKTIVGVLQPVAAAPGGVVDHTDVKAAMLPLTNPKCRRRVPSAKALQNNAQNRASKPPTPLLPPNTPLLP